MEKDEGSPCQEEFEKWYFENERIFFRRTDEEASEAVKEAWIDWPGMLWLSAWVKGMEWKDKKAISSRRITVEMLDPSFEEMLVMLKNSGMDKGSMGAVANALSEWRTHVQKRLEEIQK